MDTIAVLIDGGFYQRRAHKFWGDKTPADRAAELHSYCCSHLNDSRRQSETNTRNGESNRLYRIFYYDCPPSCKKVFNPLTQKQVDLSLSPQYRWMIDFLEEMRHKRKVALRLGSLSEGNLNYVLKPEPVKKLLRGDIKVSELMEKDIKLNIEQKGVDMRIGLDIASMAYKKQVTKMVLISGDSDFVPAAKLARREGIDFVLDPMWATIKCDLMEHIDGLKTYAPNPRDRPQEDAEE